jgi:hypothetical protein
MPDESGPNFENLLRLRDILPSYIKGHASRHLVGRGRSFTMPDKVCKVCSKVWGRAPAEAVMKHLVCGDCQNAFNDGFAAIVGGGRAKFVKSPDFKPGEILYVDPETMDAIEQKEKEKNADSADLA